MRVLSDGDNGSARHGGYSGSQSVNDSVGAVQVGPVDAQAPVRVASDGENRPSAGSGSTRQTSHDSVGTVQVGATDVRAPIRVLSDGDDESAGSGASSGTPGSQSSTDSVGVAQIAPIRLELPVRLVSDGGAPSGSAVLPVGNDGAGSQALPPSPSGTQGRGFAELASSAVKTLDAYGPGSLPVAGLGLIGLLLLGSLLLAAGSGLRLARV